MVPVIPQLLLAMERNIEDEILPKRLNDSVSEFDVASKYKNRFDMCNSVHKRLFIFEIRKTQLTKN